MEIKEINNKEEWEKFLEGCEEKTFFDSWNWGEFNLEMGNKIWRLGVANDKGLIATALVLKIKAKRGTFLFIPHGPALLKGISFEGKKRVLEALLLSLRGIAKQDKASFIRISPLFELNKENQDLFSKLGFMESPMHASSYESTWKLDLTMPEEELLKNMRKTTRYLIRKVRDNKDVKIIKSNDLKDVAVYQKLNKAVSIRQGFIPFSEELIKKEFEIFSQDKQALIFLGKYNSEMVAGAIVIFWQGIGFYHQAASLGKFAKFSIPYLLQWEAIKEAKKRGCMLYDFWGFTDPKKFPKHPWAGPTLFKMGFGGHRIEYVKTQDFVVSNKYWINYIIEMARKIWRRL